MTWLKIIIDYVKNAIYLRKRQKELKRKDPFIYK
jgi:hypothetical protein